MESHASMEKTESPVAQIDIGGVLKSTRENKGVTVSEVAASTNLSKDVIEYIESNHFDKIGTSVYVRGYLGIYAKYLGLEAVPLINAYDLQFPSDKITIKPSVAHSMRDKRQQSIRHSKTVSLLVSGLVLCALVYGYSKIEPILFNTQVLRGDEIIASDTTTEGNVISQADGASDNTNGTEQLMNAVESAELVANDALTGIPIGAPSITDGNHHGNDATVNTAAGMPSIDLASDDDLDIGANSSSADDQSPNSVRGNVQRNSAAATNEQMSASKNTDDSKAKANKAALHIRFSEECWLKITDANNKVLVAKVYKKGDDVRISGKLPYVFSTAKPNAMSSITLAGKAISLADYKTGRIRYTIK